MANQGSMLSKTLVIGIIFLFIGISAFNVVASMSVEKQILVTQSNSSKQGGIMLITECDSNRIIEVDIDGNIVWEYSTLNSPWDAERLANGNTLITDSYNDRVIEVDIGGTVVWEKGTYTPIDAERLANGNTLITLCLMYRVIEVDSSGTIVWFKAGLNFPTDAERINDPPTAPTIDGQTSGKARKEYEYTFNAVDPDGDDVRYFIDWGDNNIEWTGYNTSGTDVKVNHTWSEEETYIIKAKAEDTNGLVGPEGTLTVIMPRNRVTYSSLFQLLLDRFPFLEVFLRAINLLR